MTVAEVLKRIGAERPLAHAASTMKDMRGDCLIYDMH